MLSFLQFLKIKEDHDLNGGHWTIDVADDQGLQRRQTWRPSDQVKYKGDKIDRKFRGKKGNKR